MLTAGHHAGCRTAALPISDSGLQNVASRLRQSCPTGAHPPAPLSNTSMHLLGCWEQLQVELFHVGSWCHPSDGYVDIYAWRGWCAAVAAPLVLGLNYASQQAGGLLVALLADHSCCTLCCKCTF